MNVSSKRFRVSTHPDGAHLACIRDRDAPYHLHTVSTDRLMSAGTAARVSEDEFDRFVVNLIYRGE